MCGISAIFSEEGETLNTLISMSELINHRGPDDEGYYVRNYASQLSKRLYSNNTDQTSIQAYQLDGSHDYENIAANVLLGHKRLAIRDISCLGHQPMFSEDGTVAIIYNGEVYNTDELKAKLVNRGYTFRSSTDTEIILKGYIAWGESLLHRLNGMFSFIIYDDVRQEAFIARDRFGVKPLYFWRPREGEIAFGSEIKQFRAFKTWQARLNHNRAFDYLNWAQTDHTSETMFADVFQVLPGHYCKLSIYQLFKPIKFIRWYSIPSQKFDQPFDVAVSKFHELFYDSVNIRLKADVPVGTCLSGGLDSSSIVCVVNEIINQGQTQKTFSSCSEYRQFDEREYVYEVLNKTKNVKSNLFDLEHDKFLELLPKIIYMQDEPFLSPSVFAEWCVFEQVSKAGVKVTLDGHGADEQLLGYHTFFGPFIYNLLRRGQLLNLIREVNSIKKRHGYGIRYAAQKISRGILPDKVIRQLFNMTNRPSENVDWINLAVLNLCNRGKLDNVKYGDVEGLSLEQITQTSIPKQLHWCDRDSMAFSVESRVPFLDYRVVEFLHSLPIEFKFSKGITKRVLREGMKSYLPDKVRNRIDKMGFVTPAEIWVKDNKPYYKSFANETIESAGGILNHNAHKKLNAMIDGKLKFDHSFWRILFFSSWMKVHDLSI